MNAARASAITRLAGRRKTSKVAGRSGGIAYRVASLVAALALWQLLSGLLPAKLLPTPLVVSQSILDIIVSGQFVQNAQYTVLRVAVGFAIAFTLSLFVGVAMGLSRPVREFFESYILIGLTVPGFVWAIIGLIWFGISEFTALFCVLVITFPVTTLNVWKGTQAIDQELVYMARSFRVGAAWTLKEVVLPQLYPYLVASMRYGFSFGWKVVVLSEMLGLSNGVGFQINMAYSMFSMRNVLAWTICFMFIVVFIEYGVFQPIERRAFRWRTGQTIVGGGV